MRFNKVVALVATFCARSVGHAQTNTLSDYLKSTGLKTQALEPPSAEETPQWLKDSKRLNELLGSDAKTRIENAKVVHKVPKAFAGLDAFVVEGTEYSDDFPDGKQELYFFYSDAAQEYLFIGMAIDMKRGRDVSMDLERYLRGQLAESPAKALRPQEMHSIDLVGGKNAGAPLSFVVDLGPQAGRDSFMNVVQLHRNLMAAGANPRTVRFIFVSNAKNELSSAAMAIGYGTQAMKGDGIERLMEFAHNGEKTSWLQPRKIGKDQATKQMLGTGIFKLDNNSTQALLAKLNTLPLIYAGSGGKTTKVPLTLSAAEWKKLLTSK